MKRPCALLLVGVLLLAAGCETVKGIGKDVSAVGGWLSRGAEKTQHPDAEK